MANKKKPLKHEPESAPHDVLRRPAQPPKPNMVAFFVAFALFFAWFVYLVYVAVYG